MLFLNMIQVEPKTSFSGSSSIFCLQAERININLSISHIFNLFVVCILLPLFIDDTCGGKKKHSKDGFFSLCKLIRCF